MRCSAYHILQKKRFDDRELAESRSVPQKGVNVTRSNRFVRTTVAAALITLVATASPAHAAPGDFDLTFGTGGKVTTDFGANPAEPEISNGMFLQPDGKIITVGRAGATISVLTGDTDFALARYTPDGALDPSFGNGGTVKTDFGLRHVAVVRAGAVQDDGKIVVGGLEGLNEFTANAAIVRYNTDGSLDTTFANGGKFVRNFCQTICPAPSDGDGLGDGVRDLRILHDGKILAVGAVGIQDLIFRLNPDGSLDGTFGTGGFLVPNLGVSGHLLAMEMVGDGKFLGIGTVLTAQQTDFLLARFNADGSLDDTFGTGGIVSTDFTPMNDIALDADIDANGDIVLGGLADSGMFNGMRLGAAFALARYHANGSLDTSFGNGGKLTKDLTTRQEVVRTVKIQDDGKILAIGVQDEDSNFPGDPKTGQMAVLRYDADGTPDTTFGNDGLVTPIVNGVGEAARGAALSSGGLIVSGGATNATTGVDFALIRLKLS
jgi:uncharacterized delta-60 repeat protein